MNRSLGGLMAAVTVTLMFSAAAVGQLQNLPPELRRSSSDPNREAYRQIQIQRILDAQQITAMRRAEQEARNSAKINEVMPSVSPADMKRIEALLTPLEEDFRKYKEFLDLDRTGIFKLFPQSPCEDSRVVRADGECANSVPGGSSYSFRARSKTPDIHYLGDKLFVKGFFAHHLLANIGNSPIESLRLDDKHLKGLSAFVPSPDFEGARSQSADIEAELVLDGTKYSNQADIVLDSTYLLRIVAYKNDNNLQRRLNKVPASPSDPVQVFEKLQNDNRLDLTIAFRIIRKDEHGNLTIIWRELDRKKPPVITFGENVEMADFN